MVRVSTPTFQTPNPELDTAKHIGVAGLRPHVDGCGQVEDGRGREALHEPTYLGFRV